jgi:FAD/FMN-containing dehydrogenase
MAGRLSRPGSPTYGVDHELYDPVYDSTRPAAIAFCANAADVARCTGFARDHGLPLAARSGGHSYAGYSTTTGVVIDVSLMARVAVSPKQATATVGAGARLIDVYSDLAGQGVSVPAGSCPTVGIAGLALGGGIGVMDRLHGLTCDHIVGLEVVTAAGEVVQADAATNADLYWACRGGGGGNFGVVTELRFSTFQTFDLCTFGLNWPWQAAAQLLPAWLDWAPRAPDPLWSNCMLQAEPGAATPAAHVAGVWAGSQGGARAQLAKLVAAVGPPSSQYIADNSYADAMYVEAGCAGMSQAACHLGGKYPGGTLPRAAAVAKSDIIKRPLGDAGVRALLAGVEQRQQQGGPGGAIFDSWGGAINKVAPGETAFVHRDALASAQYVAVFPEGVGPGELAAARAWMDGWCSAVRPYVSGEAYQNYIDPALANWARAYYGANLPRLQRVKATWDPDDVFHFAQSIPLPPRPKGA